MKNLILLIVAVLTLAACNTIAGVGQDMQKAGESVESAAKKK